MYVSEHVWGRCVFSILQTPEERRYLQDGVDGCEGWYQTHQRGPATEQHPGDNGSW